MGIEHHQASGDDRRENSVIQRLVAEMEGRAQRAYPDGRICGDDDGETAYAIAADTRHGVVKIVFTKPMQWIALDIDSAVALRDKLTEKITELKGIAAG